VFAYDRLRTGEYSSSAENASGSMRITRATCARTMRLSFTIAAGLDTEVGDGPPLRVRGAFSARAS
jgi:hypothetical protein